jgi:CRP/FNR family cyclic AMP-dependent transcriptional regulator
MDLIPLFEHTAEQERHAPGSVIFHEGDPGNAMYVLLEGEVDIRINGNTVYTALPGDFFGEMALIETRERSATAIARTDCRLAPVSERRFLFMVEQTPYFSLHVMRVLVERLRRADDQIALA